MKPLRPLDVEHASSIIYKTERKTHKSFSLWDVSDQVFEKNFTTANFCSIYAIHQYKM